MILGIAKNKKLEASHERDSTLDQFLRCQECPGSTIYSQTNLTADKRTLICDLCKEVMRLLVKIESEPDIEYEFDPVLEEYDPNEDPDEALWEQYHNPDPCDYIDALRAGYYD